MHQLLLNGGVQIKQLTQGQHIVCGLCATAMRARSELCMRQREEMMQQRDESNALVRSQQTHARLSQAAARVETAAVMATVLDEAQIRAIVRAAVMPPAPLQTLQSQPDSRAKVLVGYGGVGNKGRGGWEGAVVVTPAIRRGKDVVFHSAVAVCASTRPW